MILQNEFSVFQQHRIRFKNWRFHHQNIWNGISRLFWILSFLYQLFWRELDERRKKIIISNLCYKSKCKLWKILFIFKLNETLMFQLKMLTTQIIQQPIRFKVFNIFVLNKMLMFEMLTVSISYIIVLLQYEMDFWILAWI